MKIVIHGAIDGSSRRITYLQANDNNRGETVRQLFLGPTQEYGWSQKIRADYGGQNLLEGQEIAQARSKSGSLSF